MKAIVMTAAGNPDVLQLQDVPQPQIQSDTQIRVKLYAAGINPIDTKLRQRGTFYPDRTPTILGCDGAGIVEAIGPKVDRFQVGDEVYFCDGGMGGSRGNYAEFAVVEQHCVAFKPTSLSFTEAAAVPLVAITAWESLYDRARLQAGQAVLIHAGAGGVGHVAIQLAKLQGATVCTTVSSPEKAEFVRQLGADYPIVYTQTDWVQAVLDWTEGEGVDIAFDTVGGDTFYQTCSAVRRYGDLVTILEPDPHRGSLKNARLRNLRIGLELMLTPMLDGLIDEQDRQSKILQQCARLIDRGSLKVEVARVFPLAEAAGAHQLLERGSMQGKLVLTL